MITITLSGTSLVEICNQMTMFMVDAQAQAEAPVHVAQMELPVQEHKEEEEVKPFDLEVQKKRTRRTKEQIEADKAEASPKVMANGKEDHGKPEKVAPTKVSQSISRQHVHEALQQVNVAVGLPKSREILTSFGANRISEIREEQFKAFVDKCNEAVMLQG